MDRLFGAPTGLLAFAAAGTLALVLLTLGLLMWRRPLLVRLGLRSVPRRPLRTVLIVLGLTTSTAVIATAIGTGETMAGTIRAAVAGGIGPVDQVIIDGGSVPAAPGLRDPKAVLAGADLAAGTFFPRDRVERLRAALNAEATGGIAALEPAIQTQATLVAGESERARDGVSLIGLRPGATVFDRFRTPDGGEAAVADLDAGEVLINLEAARLLGVGAGGGVTITVAGGRAARWRVRAVVADGGLAGIQPAAFATLPAVQTLLDRPDEVNQIYVADSEATAARSRQVAGALRLVLADAALLERVARGLATENGQGQLRALEGRVRPEARPAIRRLRAAAADGRPSATLAYYLADPILTTQYRWVLNAIAGSSEVRGRDLSERIAPLTVIEVKQRAILAANEYGSAVTTVFLILGLFSIAASLLLVFLIFVMLAAERRTEMGLARAVGAQRGHLITAFAVEGLVYDLAAALLGLLLGVGIGAAVLRLLSGVLGRFDVQVRGQMSAGSIVLSFSLGALVTFATVLLAAWRVSRVNVIAAIHGLAEPERRRRPVRGLWPSLRRAAALLGLPMLALGVLGGGLVLVGSAGGPGPRQAGGGALAVIGVALLVRQACVGLGMRRPLADRLIASAAGPAIALAFALSPAAPPAVRTDAVIRSGTAGFVLAGVAMALALVWAAGRNLDLLLWPVRLLARPFGALAPATRMAVAYPLTHPFRTGLTAAMFALVFLTMVAATALLRSTEAAYVKRDGGAGFDLRALFSTPPADLAGALAASASVRPEDFALVGGQAMSPVEAIWPGEKAAAWRPVEVRVADAALLGGSTGQLLARAEGYRTDEAVWRTLRDQPGTALVSRWELGSLPAVEAALAASPGGIPQFAPAAVWVRDPRGGPARRLTVIGVTGQGEILPSGLLASRDSMAGSAAAAQPPTEYFLRTREDVSYRTAATGFQLTFPENGVRMRVLGDEARTGQAVRQLLDTLIRGFLGMGLASGIAALGVIGMRSVAERRQQIGMMRALGFSRRSVQATFLIEGSVVAVLGITVGGVVGLVLARNVMTFLARDFRQLELIVPWGQVLAIGGAAYGAALLSALIVAWQAGRVSPAEALRYE